jgi:hypothetical protein
MNPGEDPIWYPPISAPWIVSILLLIAAVNVEALPDMVHRTVLHPAGFFVLFLVALGAYDAGFPPAAFAILYFVLIMWTARQKRMEGFHSVSGTMDWVTTSKRWFVEAVLKEKPMGIQEKDVNTYPVQGDNSLPSSGASR